MKITVKTQVIFLVVLAIIATIGAVQWFGVHVVGDSNRYTEYADGLRNGLYFDPHNFWYFGYVLFHFILRLFSTSPFVVVVFQMLLFLIGCVALYRLVILVSGNTTLAFVTCLLYLLLIEPLSWNTYLLSEGFYGSMVCISLFCLLYWHSRNSVSRTHKIVTIIIIVLTIFAKPTGIALLGALLGCLYFYTLQKIPSAWVKSGITLLLFCCFLLLINKMLTTYTLIENDYSKGEIIYGMSTKQHQPYYSYLMVTPPEQLYIPDTALPPLVRIVLFIVHHPVYWLRLLFTKLFFFFLHIRPYWTLKHNIFNLLFLLPLYWGTIQFFLKRGAFWVKTFTTFYLLLHALSIGLSTVDWDGRFLTPVFPVLFILGVAYWYSFIGKKLNPPNTTNTNT